MHTRANKNMAARFPAKSWMMLQVVSRLDQTDARNLYLDQTRIL